MNKPLALALLVVGIVLLAMGINASNSATSEVSQALTGAPTDKSVWLIALGALGVIVGGIGVFRRRA